MNWFANLKLGTKLITSYMVIALIAAFIGLFGNYKLHKLDDADTFLYEKMTVPLAYMAEVTQGFERTASNIAYVGYEKNGKYLSHVDEAVKGVNEHLGLYKKTLIDAEDEKNYKDMLDQWGVDQVSGQDEGAGPGR